MSLTDKPSAFEFDEVTQNVQGEPVSVQYNVYVDGVKSLTPYVGAGVGGGRVQVPASDVPDVAGTYSIEVTAVDGQDRESAKSPALALTVTELPQEPEAPGVITPIA